MAWTPEAIERHVRSITRTCRGHMILTVDERQMVAQLWQEIVDEGSWLKAMALKWSLENFLKTGAREIQQDDWETMTLRIAQLATMHTEDCGYDFNNIILSGPIDGKRHSYTCPKCGQTGVYDAPWFGDDEEGTS